jgi:pimeloyl-ACP methyl ester carboxylesterase
MTGALTSSNVGVLLLLVLALASAILTVGGIAGVIAFGYAYGIAPALLFSRHPLTAPYAGQKPPPGLPRAMLREIWTAILFYLSFALWPWIRGYRNRPGQNATPIVFVHGYAVSRSSWFWFMRMLARRGVTRPMYALAFNWLVPVERSSHALAALIERALAEQNATQVDIVAHSWGGFLSRWYIEKLGHGDRVRRLIAMGTPFRGSWMVLLGFGAPRRQMFVGCPTVYALEHAPPSPPYATLWAECDEIVVPPQHALLLDPGANPVFVKSFPATGHLTLQRDPAAADVVARLLEDPHAWTAKAGASGG